VQDRQETLLLKSISLQPALSIEICVEISVHRDLCKGMRREEKKQIGVTDWQF